MTRWVVAGLAVVAVLVVGMPVLMLASLTGMDAASALSACLAQMPATSASVNLSTLTGEQRTNASTIVSVGQGLVGPQGEVIAVAAALVESNLLNLPVGDRDSAGLFQMRPSQGWGTHKQVTDPVYASDKFYSVLAGIPGWAQLPPGVAAQFVERSAFPGRYAAKIAEASAIVSSASSAPMLASGLCPNSPLPNGLPASVAQAIAQASQPVQLAIEYALSKLGDPYVWGATGPNAFDCSGLVMMAYRAGGLSLPRTTFAQLAAPALADVTAGPVLPGDLVYPEAGHVGMALGAGWWVEAPHTGDVVKISPMPNVWAARRIVS